MPVWNKDFILLKSSFDAAIRPESVGHCVYTDGSRLKEKTGCGRVAFFDHHNLGYRSTRISDKASVFQAEIYALKLAAEYICQNWGLYEGKHLKIFSDSRAALLAIDSPFVKSALVFD